MRSENDRFRSWKLQNEKQLAKLSNNDRKMQSAMVKMENKFSKERNVLKRKMEEAVATNKRLKV
jgi:kinesin family member 4